MEFLGVVIALFFTGLVMGAGALVAVRVLRRAFPKATPRLVAAVARPQPVTPAPARSTPSRPDAPATRLAPPAPASRYQPGADGVPASLPLRRKQFFLARSEQAFLHSLEAALPPGYRVFPNVRLNDLFFITTRHPGQQKAAYARLRDKHVDFLVVSLPELTPVFAIELDGDSHDTDAQQYRDAVKDVAFASGGLRLVRARGGHVWTPDAVRAHVQAHLAAG